MVPDRRGVSQYYYHCWYYYCCSRSQVPPGACTKSTMQGRLELVLLFCISPPCQLVACEKFSLVGDNKNVYESNIIFTSVLLDTM